MFFEGVTWSMLLREGVQYAGAIALPISILIGLLPPSGIRPRLIWHWTLVPAYLLGIVAIASLFIGMPLLVLGLMLLVGYALPWFVFAPTGYLAVVRMRRLLDGLGSPDDRGV